MPAPRDADALVEQVARDTHGVIRDAESRAAFTPDAWHQHRAAGRDGDVPDAQVRQDALLASLFGAFNRGLPPGDVVMGMGQADTGAH